MTIWNCGVEGAQGLTVGSRFSIKCSGSPVAPLQADAMAIMDERGEPFGLKILEVQSVDESHLNATVTSYTPAQYKDVTFKLSDGRQTIELKGIDFSVGSVLQREQKQEPYPAFPPWTMAFPLWLWFAIGLAILLPSLGTWSIARRKIQRRKLIEGLKKQKTARPPFDELHRELRQLERTHGLEPKEPQKYVEDLNRAFRLYLVRELTVPAFDWSDREIMHEIKRSSKHVFIECEKPLGRLLRELRRASRTVPSINDCQQLTAMVRETSEGVFKIQSQNRRGLNGI